MTHHDPTAPVDGTDMTRGQMVEMIDGALAAFIADAQALSRAWHGSREPRVIVTGAIVGGNTLAGLIHACAVLASHDAQQDAIDEAAATIGLTIPDTVEVSE